MQLQTTERGSYTHLRCMPSVRLGTMGVPIGGEAKLSCEEVLPRWKRVRGRLGQLGMPLNTALEICIQPFASIAVQPASTLLMHVHVSLRPPCHNLGSVSLYRLNCTLDSYT